MNYKLTKYACYVNYLIGACVFTLPPMLFVAFHETYCISYTLLGTLVLTNFCTQFLIDLVFTIFGKKFNLSLTLKIMPMLVTAGFFVYALIPMLAPQHAYIGLLIGTILFSVSAGLSEVLLSAVIAALPSDNPERDMSALHSLYGYGVVTTVVLSSIYLKVFGTANWMYLAMFWGIMQIIPCVMFFFAPIPNMDLHNEETKKTDKKRYFGIALCFLCIFLGSAAENSMTNWISSFMESALQIPKAVGDLLGLMVFAILLALTRTWYAKYGKDISTVLLIGMIGASVCYVTAGLCPYPIVSMIACILVGIFSSMLWPGTLILMEEKYPGLGVVAYAIMAAGGDFGASVAPQMIGIVVDNVAVSSWALEMSSTIGITAEQIGMKTGILSASIFPILGIFLLIFMKHYFKKEKNTL